MSDKVNNSRLILIVEDSAIQAEMLRRILAKEGYRVGIARDGAEGLKMAQEEQPALIISDINMPVMDGYEMCRKIKHDDAIKDIPVVLLTQLYETQEIIMGLGAGADSYFSKPYDEEYLIAKVKVIIENPIRFINDPNRKSVGFEYDGKFYEVQSGRTQSLSFLLSTYENAIIKNIELNKTQAQLKALNEQLDEKVKEKTAELRKSEEKFRGLTESTSDWVWEVNESGTYTYASPKVKELLGYEPQEIIGKSPFDLMPQEEATKVSEEFGAIINAGRPFIRLENTNLHKDGHLVVLETSGVPIVDAEGRLRGYRGIDRDITGRKQAEEALRASEKNYRNLVDNAAVGVYKSNLKGDILFVNKALARIYEFESPEEMMSAGSLARYKDPEDRERLLEGLIKNNRVDNFEADAVTKTGKVKHVLFNATLDGDFLSGMVLDITERNKLDELIKEYSTSLEEEVKSRTLQLETANKDLESFSYSVSHDLKAPLRAIDGFSGIILEDYRDRLDDEGKRLLNVVRDNARKMGRLIDDILAFSRTGRKEFEIVKVDMEGLVSEVIDEIKADAADRNIRFEIKALPPVMGDRAALRQVFVNLIANAVKFTRTIETAVIEIGCIRQAPGTRHEAIGTGDEVVYYVKDNGVGFDMQYSDKLFGVFSRLHSEDDFEGTGIGLAIVKRIIEKHGGRVHAEGKVGEGAVFYFTLIKDIRV